MIKNNRKQADRNWDNIEEIIVRINPYNINVTRYDTDYCQIVWTPPKEIIIEGTTDTTLNMLKAINKIEIGDVKSYE